jgi:hypothetical protein
MIPEVRACSCQPPTSGLPHQPDISRERRGPDSDPDATWGHRSAVSTRAAGSFYGYKLHQVVCAITGLPLAWRVETAKDPESTFAMPLLDAMRERGFRPGVAIMDMGYDHEAIYTECEQRHCHPIIPLRETPAVKAGKHRPPASTGSGRSPGPTPSGGPPSGVAPRQSAPRRAGGSGRAGCTP